MSQQATLIESADFRYTAEIKPFDKPPGSYWLTIRSRWASARHPDEEQVRFSACLDRQGMENLAELIERQLKAAERQAQPRERSDA